MIPFCTAWLSLSLGAQFFVLQMCVPLSALLVWQSAIPYQHKAYICLTVSTAHAALAL